jgi:hypothetical protein
MRNTKFMNKIKKLFIFILLTGFAFSTSAQAGFSKNVDALATVVAPIAISVESAMQFGDISRMAATGGGTPTDGVLTINATTGVVTTKSGDVQAVAGGTASSAASITVTGESTAKFSLTITEETPLTLTTLTAGTTASDSQKMVLSNFTQSGAATENLLTGGGSLVITIGADLAVDKEQETGSYAGSILVVAEYE